MDALTFQAEVKQVQKLLFRIAWSYMGNLQDVEDVVQDAIGMAWAKRNTLRDESQFGAWISRILANRCKNVLRKRKLMSFFPLEEDSVTVDPPVIETPVEEALNSLAPELRLVMSLHYYDGYTIRQISELLGIPMGTIQTRLMRARNKLKEILSVEWEVEV